MAIKDIKTRIQNRKKKKAINKSLEHLFEYKQRFFKLDEVEVSLYKTLLKNHLESTKIMASTINKTKSIAVFVQQFQELIELLEILSEHEFTNFFEGSLPSEIITRIINNKSMTEISFLKRSYGHSERKDLLNDKNTLRYLSSFSEEAMNFIRYGIEPEESEHKEVHRDIRQKTSMDGIDFEHYCSKLLLDSGFEKAVVTKASGDQGADILAEKDGIRYAIQCKHYTGNVGNDAVQEAHASKCYYNCHVATVMTNSYFTASAKELGDKLGVLLWDGEYLENKFISHNKRDASGEKTPEVKLVAKIPKDCDMYIFAAVEVILDTKQTSVSMLQRRLNLSYSHAERILDELWKYGIVGPFIGDEPRKLLITRSQWETIMKNSF